MEKDFSSTFTSVSNPEKNLSTSAELNPNQHTYIGDPPISSPLTGDYNKTPVSNGFGHEYCCYRLPCGICTKLGYMCPMQYNKHEITCCNTKSN